MIKGIVIGLIIGLGLMKFYCECMQLNCNDRQTFEEWAVQLIPKVLIFIIILVGICLIF